MRATVSIALCTLLVACGVEASETTQDSHARVEPARLAPRIVGGSTSTSAQDATVYLAWNDEGGCTGTLVSSNLVLTARHCVSDYGWGGTPECGLFHYDYPAAEFSVRVGVNAADGLTAAHVTKIDRPMSNDGCDDIALVQLDRPLTQVKPAPVRFTKPAVGETTTAVGYGEDGFGWIPSQRKQRANLPLKAVGPATFDYLTQDGWSLQVEVPAKTIATGESTCFGDSGGPLFDGKGAVIGVTSRGIDDDCVDRPTLYTATAAFETMIRDAAKSAGQPLAEEVTTKSAPVPGGEASSDSKDGEDKPRTKRTTDDSEDGLDEPTNETQEEALAESSCSATPKRAPAGSSAALAIAMVAILAMIARRNRALLVVPVTTMLAACSSAPPYSGTPLSGSDVRDGDATDEDDSTSSDTMSLEDGPGSGGTGSAATASKSTAKGACAGETTQKACFECCTDSAPAAVETYTRLLEGCLCQSPGTCKASCSDTLCAGFKADTTCAECLRTAGLACEDSAFTACEKDASCSPMLQCASDSRCSAK